MGQSVTTSPSASFQRRYKSMTKLLEPRTEPLSAALGGHQLVNLRPIRRKDAALIAAEAKASAGAMASIVLGTFCCVCGAVLAGTMLWRYHGRPDSGSFISERKERWQERAKAIDAGGVGQTVRSIGQTAAVAIPEHEGLQNMASGLKKQFNKDAAGARRAPPAGSAPVTTSSPQASPQ